MARLSNWALYRRIWQESKPCRGYLIGILLLSSLAAPLALLSPLPLKIAVDNVIGHRPLPGIVGAVLPEKVKHSQSGLLLFAVGLVVGVAVLSQLRDFGTSLLTTYAGEKLLREFRARLFRHVQRLSLSYHDTQGTADSTYRIQYDAAALQHITVEGAVPLIASALTLGSMIYMTIRINWRLALVALAVSPAIFVVTRSYRRRLRSQAREVKKLESSALAVVHEVLGAARVVKAFCQEEREAGRFVAKSNEGMQARIGLSLKEGAFGVVVALITALGMAAVLYIGVSDIRSGELSLGDLLLVMGYLAQFYAPLKTISKKMATMQTHLAGAERAYALLDQATDVEERPHARALDRAKGAMEFREVTFGYEPDHPVLRGITLAIAPGTCLGIVGQTGAGKTTLTNLLTRFYDPTSGQILLDGLDLRDYKLSDLQHQFAIVLQEPVLFSSSIAENIAYARPGASQTEILAAAQAANAHDFIVALSRGYQTVVGERGMRLSGGERQRISIARAFLRDAPILILDEPTSAVDVKTEAAIVEAMGRLMRGRTTFIIAHRPSTLNQCDFILRLEAGRMVGLERASRCGEDAQHKPTEKRLCLDLRA